MGKMTKESKSNKDLSTHGVMTINFAVNGMNEEEVREKFENLLKVTVENETETIELELFDSSIVQLETFEGDEF